MTTVYMAVTGSGQISTSPDGVTWTKSASTVTDPTQGPLVFNVQDNSFMLVDNTNSFLRRIDTGGVTINTFALPNKSTVFTALGGSLAYNPNTKTIVMGGLDNQTGKVNNSAVAISVNFGSWTVVDLETSGSGNQINNLAYDSTYGRLFATDGAGNIYSSTNNGTSWTSATSLTGGANVDSAITSGSTNHAVIGGSTGAGAYNYTTNGTSYSSGTATLLASADISMAYDATNNVYGMFSDPVLGGATNAFGVTSNPFTALPSMTYVNSGSSTFQTNCALGFNGVFYIGGGISSPILYSINSGTFTTLNTVTTGFTGSTRITGLAVGTLISQLLPFPWMNTTGNMQDMTGGMRA